MTGTHGQSGRNPGDHGIAQVTCPKQSHQPGLQSCSHRGSSRAQCGGSEALPARPLLRDSCPVSKGLFAERPPGLKGQHPEPQPASCHQGPCLLCLLIINPGEGCGLTTKQPGMWKLWTWRHCCGCVSNPGRLYAFLF